MKSLKQIFLVCAVMVFGAFAANAQSGQAKSKSWELNYELGPDFSMQSGGGTSFAMFLDYGMRFKKVHFVGLGLGSWTGSGSSTMPVFGTYRADLNLDGVKIVPRLTVRTGYVISGSCWFSSFDAGILYPVNSSLDLSVSCGYTSFWTTPQSGTVGLHMGIRVKF